MPQLDTATYLPQLFWLVVSFVVMYLLMARIALPRIGEVLRTRRERVETDLQRAESLKAEAETALAAYQESLEGARTEAHRIAAEAVQTIAAETENRNDAMTARLAQEAAAAEARIVAAKDAALADLKSVASDVVGVMVPKLIGTEADAAAVAQAVDAATERHGTTG